MVESREIIAHPGPPEDWHRRAGSHRPNEALGTNEGENQSPIAENTKRPVGTGPTETTASLVTHPLPLAPPVPVGLVVEMDLPELGLTDLAWVTDISDCPEIKPVDSQHSPSGRVVTATFHHSSGDVIDLVVEDTAAVGWAPPTSLNSQGLVGNAHPTSTRPSDETIGTTSNHPFWSVDRQEYVQAGQLDTGERVLTFSGDTKRVVTKLPRPGPQPVYNLEVHAEHVYFVGQDGLLVHNSQNYDKLNGQGLYVLRDKDDVIRYVGIGDVPTRLGRHATDIELINGIRKSDLTAQVVHDVGTLSKAEARGLEQLLIGRYGGPLSREGTGQLVNKAVSFLSTNKNRFLYRSAVTKDLWKRTLKTIAQGEH